MVCMFTALKHIQNVVKHVKKYEEGQYKTVDQEIKKLCGIFKFPVNSWFNDVK